MLCPDSGKGSLEKRIKEAADNYLKERGRWPKVCYVPTTLLKGKEYPQVPGTKVLSDDNLQPGDFRFGS